MVAIVATDSLTGLAGYFNAHISSALRGFAVDYWPVHQADIGTTPAVPLVRVSAEPNARAIVASDARSYFDDYYNRVHMIPPLLAMGNIVSAQMRSITVWNAYTITSQTLTAVPATGIAGLTITAPGPLPIIFRTLAEKVWAVDVLVDGPPTVQASLTWQFTGLLDRTVLITGSRVSAWVWRPNWASNVIERDSWMTNTLQADTGAEQRIALRLTPRRSWEFGVVATGNDRQWLESALFDWGAHIWALPVWTDVQRLPAGISAGALSVPLSPDSLDYTAGGLVLLWNDATHYEVAEIVTLGATLGLSRGLLNSWPAGTRVYPMRLSRMAAQTHFSGATADMLAGRVLFASAEDLPWPAVAPSATYRSLPVLGLEPLYTAPRPQHVTRLLDTLDNATGLPDVVDSAGIGYPVLEHTIRLDNPAERASWRSITYALRGSQGVLWVPTFRCDLSLLSTFTSVALSLDVQACGLVRFVQQQPGRRDIRIELRDGSLAYRRITAVTTISSSIERLTLDAVIGIAGSPATVRRISWLVASRLLSDTIEYAHSTAHVSHVQVAFRGVPDDV